MFLIISELSIGGIIHTIESGDATLSSELFEAALEAGFDAETDEINTRCFHVFTMPTSDLSEFLHGVTEQTR